LKKFFALVLLASLLLHYTTTFAAEQPQNLSSKAVALASAENGQILFDINGHDKFPPGGLTKVLTAIVALEQKNSDDPVTISNELAQYVLSTDPTAKLRAGEEIQLKHLINAMLVGNANDAAIAIALFVSGDVDTFCGLMNSRAERLGCQNSFFVNATGNDDAMQYSTAIDLAKIMHHAVSMAYLNSVLETTVTTIPPTNMSTERKYTSNNHIIQPQQNKYYYSDALGGKTGYIDGLGYNLASSASRDDISLICVVIGADESNGNILSFVDIREVFEYGFKQFLNITPVDKDYNAGSIIVERSFTTSVTLKAASEFSFLMDRDSTEGNVVKRLEVPEKLVAPVKKGSPVGTLVFEYGGQVIGSVPLVAGEDANISVSTVNIAILSASFIVVIYIFVIIFKSFRE